MPSYFTVTSTAPGAQPIPVELPTHWGEVSMGTYLRLLTPHPEHSVLSVLSGLAPALIDQLQAGDVKLLTVSLGFALDHAPLLELEPTPGLPDIGSQPYGLLQMATMKVNTLPEGAPGILAGPYLCALYRTQQAFGKAPSARVAEAEAALLAEPVTAVYADAAFFFRSWLRFMNATPPTPTTPSRSKKLSWTQALRKLATVSGRSPRSTRSAKASA